MFNTKSPKGTEIKMFSDKRDDLLKSFNEWLQKIEIGIREKDGNNLCEATRMALAFALFLGSDFPDALTPEVSSTIKQSFKRALKFVSEVRKGGNGPDKCYDLYEQNIRGRLEKLEDLQRSLCKASSSP